MDSPDDRTALRVGRTLEQEIDLVREAILMVEARRAPRVVVAGIRFGEALLAPAQALATEAGVRLVPLWMPDDAGLDIAIEQIPE